MSKPGPYALASDNTAGLHPDILQAIVECDQGTAPPYGADSWTGRLNTTFSEIFEREAFVFATPTGTGANALALGAVTPAYGAIFCHEASHIVTSECGAPEFFSAGARLVQIAGADHKISSDSLSATLAPYTPRNAHSLRPAALSLTQSTESGTLYSLSEIAMLTEIARKAGLKTHMDGARFANALVALGVSPAEMTWRSGIDILSFGATKNGTMNVDAVVAFDRATAETLSYMHKRAGYLFSKMRFCSAQLIAYVADGLWLDNARMANRNAQRVSTALSSVPGVSFASKVEANEIFVHLPAPAVSALAAAGISFRPWGGPGGDLYRIVTSFRDAEPLLASIEKALLETVQT